MHDETVNPLSARLTDPLNAGIEDALGRIRETASDAPDTLVDLVPQEEWEARDASGELALVSDTAGPGEDDGHFPDSLTR